MKSLIFVALCLQLALAMPQQTEEVSKEPEQNTELQAIETDVLDSYYIPDWRSINFQAIGEQFARLSNLSVDSGRRIFKEVAKVPFKVANVFTGVIIPYGGAILITAALVWVIVQVFGVFVGGKMRMLGLISKGFDTVFKQNPQMQQAALQRMFSNDNNDILASVMQAISQYSEIDNQE